MRDKASTPKSRRGRAFADMPIRRKLMAIIMGATLASLAVSGIGILVADVVLFESYLQRDLIGLAHITADNSTAALQFDDPRAAAETLGALRARGHIQAACIFRPDGELFARYILDGSRADCPPPLQVESARMKWTDISVSVPIMLAGRRIGTLTIFYDLGLLIQGIRVFGAIILAVILAAGLVALLISSQLRKLIADPITNLANVTAVVSDARDYGIRVEHSSRDEIGMLVDGFNGMLSRIQLRDQELRQALVAREEALGDAREARDFLKTTLASIGDAVVSTDSKGRIVFANQVACGLMGWREEEIQGRPLEDMLRLVNEFSRETVENPVTRTLREGAISALANHTVLISRDGSEIPIDDSAAPIRDHRGELAGAVLIFRDVTERRRAEQELRATREQLQFVTDTMASAVTHCSRDLTYLWVSRRYAEWLRREPARIAGRSIEEVLGAKTFAAIRPYVERALNGERVEYERELEYAGSSRWVRAVYMPTHDRTGAVNGWVADLTDITAVKSAEAELVRVNADLQKINERLSRSNEDLERFAFVASHDLQEPLRMITTYAQLLVRTYPGRFEGEGEQFIRHVLDGAARMRGLLADLLAYSEIGSEADEPARLVDLNSVVETVRQNLKVVAEETGAEIAAGPLPVIRGYTGHFVQLLQNLAGNAIKYRGSEPPRIRIFCETTGPWFRIAVADNGIGIDPEYHAKIFGIFKRLHGRRIPGAGIGLAICKRLVERYGGSIWVESQPGQGATFYFTLPANAEFSEGASHG